MADNEQLLPDKHKSGCAEN